MSRRYLVAAALPLALAACASTNTPMQVQPGVWPSQSSPVEESLYRCTDGSHYHVTQHGITNPDGEMVHMGNTGPVLTYIAPTRNGPWQALPADPQALRLTFANGRLVLRDPQGRAPVVTCTIDRG